MDITLVFFIYGLAFFSMGLALLLEVGRSPLLVDNRLFIPLVYFGFVHGFHEWIEMFLIRSDWLVFTQTDAVNWLRIIFLVVSFSALIFFGLSILLPDFEVKKKKVILGISGICLYGILVIVFAGWSNQNSEIYFLQIDVMVRYFMGMLGAFLAGFALFRYARQEHLENREKIGASLKWAGVGFFAYAISQTVVPEIDVFPARLWNTNFFYQHLGFPIQVVRAALAILILVSVIRYVQFAEKERKKRLEETQKARLEALERVQQELEKRELMRQEHLRHIVLAQEEERSRISRELHDEASQLLTAFSLNLAMLRNKIDGNREVVEIVEYLQNLNQRISTGIYRLVRVLRPIQLDELGLVAALQNLVDEADNLLELIVHMKITGSQKKLTTSIETVLFRVSQEAINNVSRHSGVRQADLELSYLPDEICLRVQDSGKGFDLGDDFSQPGGWGIAGMRERVESVGGSFQITSAVGTGTCIEVSIPLDPVPEIQNPLSTVGGDDHDDDSNNAGR